MIKFKYDNKKGTTLIELLIALSVVAMIMVGVGSHMKVGSDMWQSEDKHAEALQNALIGLDKMTRELKQATSITSISDLDTGYIYFKNENEDNNVRNFQYNSDYAVYNDGSSSGQLAGPITKLKFSCYDATGVNQILSTDTTKFGLIRLVKIEMVATDSSSIITVPVSSEVSVGNEEEGVFKLLEYAIFGGTGVSIKNNMWVGSHPTRFDPPANVGSFSTTLDLNGVKIFGNVITEGSTTLSNGSYVGMNVYAGKEDTGSTEVTIKQTVELPDGGVMGDVNTNGDVLMENNTDVIGIMNCKPDNFTPGGTHSYIGGRSYGGLPDNFFINPFPIGHSYITPPNTTGADITSANDDDNDGIIEDEAKDDDKDGIIEDDDIDGIIELSPGEYHDVTLDKPMTLKLTVNNSSPPTNYTYYFNNITTTTNLTLDICGVTSDTPIWIFVTGDIQAPKIITMFDGLIGHTFDQLKNYAKMVYVEFGGNMFDPTGSGLNGVCGFLTGTFFANCLSGEESSKGNLILGRAESTKDSALVMGAVYARGTAEIQNPSSAGGKTVPDLTYVPINPAFLPPIWDNYK